MNRPPNFVAVCETKEEAKQVISDYFKKYPLEGYSTACVVYPKQRAGEAETFEVRCYRSESCE